MIISSRCPALRTIGSHMNLIIAEVIIKRFFACKNMELIGLSAMERIQMAMMIVNPNYTNYPVIYNTHIALSYEYSMKAIPDMPF